MNLAVLRRLLADEVEPLLRELHLGDVIGVALAQLLQPLRGVVPAIVAGNDCLENAVVLALEADVVAGAADVLAANDDLSGLFTEVALEAVQLLGGLVDLDLLETDVRQSQRQPG